jgi:predicted DNA-binding transcriptional regulator YafY
MDVDPWAVVVRHRRWYLLGWSHTKDARRVLRVDRVARVNLLPDGFTPPDDLDPVRELEDQLSQGWRYDVEVEIDAASADVEHWLPRSFGRLEALGERRTRLIATTDEPEWYAAQLAAQPFGFRVVGGPQLRTAVDALADRLRSAVE